MLHLFVRRLLRCQFSQYQSIRFLKTPTWTSPPPSDSVQYLVTTCGLPLKTSVAISKTILLELESGKAHYSASQKLQLEKKRLRNLKFVLAFLRLHGFSEDHVEDFVTRVPLVSSIRVSNVQPKIQFFLDMGFSVSDVASIIVGNPFILKGSLANHLRPNLTFLVQVLHTNDRVMKVLRRWQLFFKFDFEKTVIPNVAALVDEGVSRMAVLKLFEHHPMLMIQKQEKFVKLVQWAKELGIKPTTYSFVVAIVSKCSLSSQNWQNKIEAIKSLGLTEEEVMIAFRKAPTLLRQSEEKIRKVMEFCVNTMKLEPVVLCTYPALVMYSFEERIVPRFAVIEVLKSKKLMTGETFVWAFGLPEKIFLDKFVRKHLREVQGLMEVYQQAKLGAMGDRVSEREFLFLETPSFVAVPLLHGSLIACVPLNKNIIESKEDQKVQL
ncbi:hypothetical protein H6P81_007692 [Aristolochia fimbriata]|uniref:Uncharacterized protein n=1 Tax=Aristolochia fimbriata TaxID=158543 RepID=A0AAV7F5G7_ARIFI|nr:hypothetical protein H6P81_007692 [Aristolochia fimbriata]